MAKKSTRRTSTRKRSAEKIPARGSESIGQLRRQLDQLDNTILTAINDRAAIAEQLGSFKREVGGPIYDPQREAEIIERVLENNPGPLTSEAVRAVFRELISGSRATQAATQVAYLGPEYTFSHLAAIHQFGQSAALVPVGTIAAVFEEVERGLAQFGVVPLENSTDGRVSDTLECFSRSPVQICGELPLRINHCLLSVGNREEIDCVYSKPQALSQCRNWLAKHLPKAVAKEVASTAEAASLAQGDPRSAAIASEQAGVNFDLRILARNIEDHPDNITRFAVIATESAPPSGNDKTSLLFEIAHKPGALADSMGIFKRNRLNMTWIESFPIPGSRGRYLFLVEFVGHQKELRARRAIAALEKKSVRLDVLGSYAQRDPVG